MPTPEEVRDQEDFEVRKLAALYQPVNWEKAWEEQPEETDWLCDPFLEKGTLNALFAKPGTGKSLLAQNIAFMLTQDGKVVVVIDEENRLNDWVERLQDMGAKPGMLENLRAYPFPSLPPLDTPEGGRHLLGIALRDKADLVILDTTTRMVRGRENDSDTFTQMYRCSLAPLKARGMTVLRLDHPGKDVERGQRGSSAKDGDVDTIWRMDEVTKGLMLRMTRSKSRSGHGDHDEYLVYRYEDPLRHEWVSTYDDPQVGKILVQMDTLQIPRSGPDSTRSAVRVVLDRHGIKVGNALLGKAIKARRPVQDRPGPVQIPPPGTDGPEQNE